MLQRTVCGRRPVPRTAVVVGVLALAALSACSRALAGGSQTGEIKKLQNVVAEMEKLKAGADPYAQAGLTHAQNEVNGAISDLSNTPPDNASAIKHKKNAAKLCVAIIAKCVDTSDV